eukprot:9126341-Lingulodinium_polyedra.AAC.1
MAGCWAGLSVAGWLAGCVLASWLTGWQTECGSRSLGGKSCVCLRLAACVCDCLLRDTLSTL